MQRRALLAVTPMLLAGCLSEVDSAQHNPGGKITPPHQMCTSMTN
jgi:hypothetical protein